MGCKIIEKKNESNENKRIQLFHFYYSFTFYNTKK